MGELPQRVRAMVRGVEASPPDGRAAGAVLFNLGFVGT